MARYRVARAARMDIIDALRYSGSRFGPGARQRYLALIGATFESIAQQPERIGSHCRDELAPGLRSIHLRHGREPSTQDRVARPRHIVFYRVGSGGTVEIVRLLHEAMEVRRHLPT